MISVPFIFVSEEILGKEDKLSVKNIFETFHYTDDQESMNKSIVTMGLIGEKSDDGKAFDLLIKTDLLPPDSLKIPLTFQYIADEIVSLRVVNLNGFPILKEETIFLEVVCDGQTLNRYPVSFRRRKVKEGKG